MNPPIDKKRVNCPETGNRMSKDECIGIGQDGRKVTGHKCPHYILCWGWER